jgi:hypothetical protein
MRAYLAKADLVESGQVSQDAVDPLWAVYEGQVRRSATQCLVFAEIQLEGVGGDCLCSVKEAVDSGSCLLTPAIIYLRAEQ